MDVKNSASNSTKVMSLVTFLFFLAVLTVNALANILPINGVGTGKISDDLPNLFVPAGLTFSIWGLIYLLLAGYVVAAFVQAFGKNPGRRWGAADGAILSFNFAANIAWIFAWHYHHVALSLVFMILILGSLILLEELNASRLASDKSGAVSGSRAMRFFLTTPINVYLGWICVATIANVTALLVASGWDGFGLDPRMWTVLVIAAGLAVGLLLIFLRDAIAAPLVIVWAYAGIVIKRTGVDSDYSTAIWVSALVAAAVLLIVVGARLVARRTKA
jgi:hypothetical protein